MGEKEGARAVGEDRLRALDKRLRRFAKAHARALSMSEYIRGVGVESRRAEKLQRCGSWLLFRDYYESGRIILARAEFCQQTLLCPLCSLRRSARYLAQYLERFESLRASASFLGAYLVSVTVKNGLDLAERYSHLVRGLELLRQRRRDALRGKSSSELGKCLGAVESFEFKRGSGSRLWHPHMHAVWLCGEAPDPGKLRDEWREVTGDSWVVDSLPLGDRVKDFCEVFKYSLKFAGLRVEDNFEAWRVLRGRRLLRSWGVFRGVRVVGNLADEAIGGPFVSLLFRYVEGLYAAAGLGLDTEVVKGYDFENREVIDHA